MARGIRIPVGVNASGGTAMVEDDTQHRQVLSVGLSSGDNRNAFQQEENLGEQMIFGNDSPLFRASILRRLYEIFKDWEEQKLFRLMRETIEWSKEPGELTLDFTYIDLESDQEKQFRKNFTTRV